MDQTTSLLLTAGGVVLIALVFYDVYATVLRATKLPGPFSRVLNHGLWRLTSQFARRFDRRVRHRILTSVGPLLMPLLVACLIFMLITGFALIYMPQIKNGGFMIPEESARGGSFLLSFYFSGATFLTLGYGEIHPLSTFARSVALFEGACGIAFITLSITYLLTVYGALERKRALALNFYHQGRQGANIPGFISSHFSRGRFHSLTESLREATRHLQELLESHLEHPIIHYFHPVEVYKGLPRALFFVLETVAILNAHVDEAEYVEAGDHPDVLIAGDNARYVLAELITSLNLQKRASEAFETDEEISRRRRKAFDRALRHLRENKIKTRDDVDQAFEEDCAVRLAWERQLYYFADFLGYDWDEITGDRSLEDAADEEVIERHETLATEEEVKQAKEIQGKEKT